MVPKKEKEATKGKGSDGLVPVCIGGVGGMFRLCALRHIIIIIIIIIIILIEPYRLVRSEREAGVGNTPPPPQTQLSSAQLSSAQLKRIKNKIDCLGQITKWRSVPPPI